MSDTKRAGRPVVVVSKEHVYNIWYLHKLGVSKAGISKRLDLSVYLITKILNGPIPKELSPGAEEIANSVNESGKLSMLSKKIQAIKVEESESEESETEASDTEETDEDE